MKNIESRNIKGIHINKFNTVALIISFILFFLTLLASVQISVRYRSLINATENYIACERNALMIANSSSYLTDQVRLYVITAQKEYSDNYFSELNSTRRREQALAQLAEYDTDPNNYGRMESALVSSDVLSKHEIYAMKLVAVANGYNLSQYDPKLQAAKLTSEDLALSPEEQLRLAQEMVFGVDYQNTKSQITDSTNSFLQNISYTTHDSHRENANALKRIIVIQRALLIGLFLLHILTFAMIMLLIIRPLKTYLKNISEDKAMEITGAYEFKYLAQTYNTVYESNAAHQRDLRYKAEHDPLTGILNRSALESLPQMFRNDSGSIALLVIDIDQFKSINDGNGHETGDRVLQKVAQLLKSTFRSSDFIIRIGGDEFCVVMLNAGVERKELIRQKIGHINDALLHPDHDLPELSISVGVAFSENGFSSDLFKQADSALYQVKENGRCGCEFYEET